ncbi:nitrilase-related carbon-nitrogen hydrolase [Limnochorda pilosa]|uniref:Amidohydrolase n=1 Tax=Limnochorda pilosa TaxID=1555112 RepID=A0A0K2SMX1_LIMPI|nr:nitrilase-related carbon-nitrogen hydrolase [Limnochorda pilosa]BAS28149.1 amidohydrolase [Limnochorda pilosa]
METRRLKVAALQTEPEWGAKERNVARLDAWIRQAAGEGAALVVTPEMATTGYLWDDRAHIAPFVEPIPGPTTERFGALARELNVHIVLGLPEREPDTGTFYNTAVLLGPEGLVGRYRKVHPYMAEPHWAKNGDLGFPVFETPLGRIALVICMDLIFFEPTRVAMLEGAELLCAPVNWFGELAPSPVWLTRAYETGLPLVVANRWGRERTTDFAGGSAVIDGSGTVLATRQSGDGLVTATVEVGGGRGRSIRRRPELYADLTLSTHRWDPLTFYRQFDTSRLPPGARVQASAVQLVPGQGAGRAERLQRLARWIEDLGERGSRLIVFPELALTGLIDDAAQARAEAIPAGQVASVLEPLLRLCGRHETTVLLGGVERDGDAHFNAAWLLTPEGLQGTYRKTHLTDDERRWATPGNDLPFFDRPLGRIGVLMGDEIRLPEPARLHALRGADLLAVLGAARRVYQYAETGDGRRVLWHLARVRARENHAYVLFANYAGAFGGGSGVFGPDAYQDPSDEAWLGAEQGEGAVTLQLDTTDTGTPGPVNRVRRKPFIVLREPTWYDPLVRPR